MPITTIEDVRSADRIDSRDLIELRDSLCEWLAEDEDNAADDIEDAQAVVIAIDALEAEGIEEWKFGAHLIREDHFEDYARELADDIGAIDLNASWPLNHIDWSAAARELAMDYGLVTFLGHEYYVR